jgi:hypothetical protein
MRCQKGNILFTVPEGWDLELDDTDPEVEIHPKPAGPDLRPEVPVCGEDEAGPDVLGDSIPNATELAFIDDSQKLGL